MYINIVVVVGWFPACCPAAHLSIFISRSLLSHTVARSLSHLLSLPAAAAAAESVYLMPTCSPGSCFRGCCCCCACSCLSIASHGLTSLQPCMHASVFYICMCACTVEHVCMHLCIHICPHCCCSCCLCRSCCLPCIVFIKFYIHTNMCIHVRVRVYAWSCRCLLENLFAARHYPHYICTYAWIYIHTCMCIMWMCVVNG